MLLGTLGGLVSRALASALVRLSSASAVNGVRWGESGGSFISPKIMNRLVGRVCAVPEPALVESYQLDITMVAGLVEQADVAVVVLGDDVSMNGEYKDRANLDLSGAQQPLVEALVATGTPVVVVLINGKRLHRASVIAELGGSLNVSDRLASWQIDWTTGHFTASRQSTSMPAVRASAHNSEIMTGSHHQIMTM